MEYLRKAEGDSIQYNKGEKDITIWGIQLYSHPDAKIGKYIQKVVLEDLGIITDTADWDDATIEIVNNATNDDVLYRLAVEFYEEYLKDAHLELYNEDCKITAMSLYTNSPKRYWKAVQRALLNLQSSGRLDKTIKLSIIDGAYGAKTKNGLSTAASEVPGMTLEDNILMAMTLEYVELATNNPDRYLKYLRGWLNRLDTLNKDK